MTILFVDHLTVIDCSYLHSERGLVGESWIVDLELTGGLDEQSMVLDFGKVKKHIKTLIDDTVDHKLLLPMQNPALTISNEQQPVVTFVSSRGSIEHTSPADALRKLECPEITADVVADYLEQAIMQIAPSNVQGVQLTLHTEKIDGAFYHYSHGLKKHDGNCQRIAHGHRSKIEILLDDVRQPELEQQVADQWRDIYLGSREDLIETTNDRMHFAYQAPQGEFKLSLPAAHCDLMDTDSTVECIAEHLARQLQQQLGNDITSENSLKIRAYEGVKKGAIGLDRHG